MEAKILQKLKTVISSLFHSVFTAVVVSLISIPLLVSWFTGTLSVLWRYLNNPMPIWGLLLSALCILIYLKIQTKSNQIIEVEPEKFLIEDSGLKWQVIDHKNGYCSVNQTPLCREHEYEFILTSGQQYMCREHLNSECKSEVVDASELNLLWRMAQSKAQKVISEYKTIS